MGHIFPGRLAGWFYYYAVIDRSLYIGSYMGRPDVVDRCSSSAGNICLHSFFLQNALLVLNVKDGARSEGQTFRCHAFTENYANLE